MYGQDPSGAVYLPDGNHHFDSDQERSGARESSQRKPRVSETLQNSRDVDKLRGQTVLREHVLHFKIRPHELRVAVGQEDGAEGDAKHQEANWSQTIQRIHIVGEPRILVFEVYGSLTEQRATARLTRVLDAEIRVQSSIRKCVSCGEA